MRQDIIFYQLFEIESSTYTYILADKKTKEAAIIDPILETVELIWSLTFKKGIKNATRLD